VSADDLRAWLWGGPSMAVQLGACLVLAVVAWRRDGRDALTWLLAGLGAAVLPAIGVLIMSAACLLAPRLSGGGR